MEIILLIIAVVAVGLFWYTNRPVNSTIMPTMSSSNNLNTPPERDVYSPPVTEVKTSVSEAPVKKARKPRAPRTETVKKAASKKPAATKSTVTKSRKTRSKTA